MATQPIRARAIFVPTRQQLAEAAVDIDKARALLAIDLFLRAERACHVLGPNTAREVSGLTFQLALGALADRTCDAFDDAQVRWMDDATREELAASLAQCAFADALLRARARNA
jgi:hypothetical protein